MKSLLLKSAWGRCGTLHLEGLAPLTHRAVELRSVGSIVYFNSSLLNCFPFDLYLLQLRNFKDGTQVLIYTRQTLYQ